jgi:hypothetical protein
MIFNRKRFSLKLVRSVVLASTAFAALIYCILLVLAPPEPVPESFTFDSSASWITTNPTPQSTGCFRLDLSIPGKIVNAWITLATNGGFEVSANGKTCARLYLLLPTRRFQEGLSDQGQALNTAASAISVNFPREYQWANHENAELPTWIDLREVLHPGHNALCVEIETSRIPAALILSGEVLLDTGERIPIRSGMEWAAEPVPLKLPQESWTVAESPVSEWARARVLPWKQHFWRLVPHGVYEQPFRGKRIRSVTTGSITWLEQSFDLQAKPLEGFLRVATDTPYQIWINEHRVQIITRAGSAFTNGSWFIRDIGRSPIDEALEPRPEELEPNQIGTQIPGRQSDTPPQDRGTADHLTATDQPATTSGTEGSNEEESSSNNLSFKNSNRIVPPALTRDRRNVEFLAYSITPLLRKGRNTIRIGLYKDAPEVVGLSWTPFFAYDGGSQLPDGSISSFASGEETRCFSEAKGNSHARTIETAVDGPIEPTLLPTKRFFGYVYPDRPWFSVSIILFFLCSGILLSAVAWRPQLEQLLERGRIAFAVFAGWIGVGMLLRSAMLERSEALFFRFPIASLLLLVFGLAGAALAITPQMRPKMEGRKNALRSDQYSLRVLTRKWGWPILVASGIVLCFATRAWQIDFQPPDDDEYASLQASLAIAKTGVPEYQEGVWYTRSPLYHYLAGGVAAITGGNIYSLRLLSVLFSCATAFLIWKMGRKLMLDHFLAFGALILFAANPFLIFTGHVARFYQQQQFFHLLGLYFFLRGFIQNSGMKDRYLAILVFLAATLSQEVTVLQIVPLVICYFLFAPRRSWSDEIRVLVAAGCALAVVVLDVGFHMIKCLTALDGVSPRVEAKVGWCFEYVANFFSLFICYSRLQLVLSAFLVPGFFLAMRRKQSVWTCLYLYLFLSVVMANLLITSKGFRYQYFLIPLLILCCLHGIQEFAKLLTGAREHMPVRTTLVFGWLAAVLCSWSPWRILESYDAVLEGNPTSALRFVSENLRPGDRVAINEPVPDAALIETGQSDYDLSIPILYDFALRKKGRLVDRNTAAEVIGNLNELQQAIAKNERVWIVVDRYQMHATGKDILWQYPAARDQLYLRNNCRLAFRSFLWSVYLWDRNAGHYSSFREEPGNWFE